jgi:hypothetical protein
MFCPVSGYSQYSGTFYGAKIYFCHTTRTSLSTTFEDNYSGNTPVLVLSRSSLVLNWTENLWNQIGFDNSFNYNGADNLLIEIRWDSANGGLIVGTTDPVSGQTLLGASVGATSGSLQTYRNVFRLWYSPATQPCIDVSKFTVQESDGLIDPGETLQIPFWIRNNGLVATNVQATLTTTGSWCVVTQTNWTAGTLAQAAAASNTAVPFQVVVASGAPPGAGLGLRLTTQANSGAYTNIYPINVAVSAPILSVCRFLVNDSSGNTNLALNPGERVQVMVCITNSGTAASNAVAVLSTGNSYVSMLSASTALGTIPKRGMADNKNLPFCLQVAGNAWTNGAYPFNLDLSYGGGAFTTRLSFTAGAAYGSPHTNTSAWINTSGATSLPLVDESWAEVGIGFNFTFYNSAWSTVRVTDNGCLAFKGQFPAWNNLPITNPSTPFGIIAPFWDDIDPSAGGVIRYQSSGVAPNRKFVVEWNAVHGYMNDGIYTFQSILDESGRITFQYGPMTGTASDGSSATIGIENDDGSSGIQYSFNQVGAVTNGLALTFETSAPPIDSDHDGIPDDYELFYWGSLSKTPDQDSDGDGMSNIREMRAGTNPADSNSVLRVEQLTADHNSTNVVLRWRSVPGKLYSASLRTKLQSGSWSNLNISPYVGAYGGENQCTVNVDTTRSESFFRITTP